MNNDNRYVHSSEHSRPIFIENEKILVSDEDDLDLNSYIEIAVQTHRLGLKINAIDQDVNSLITETLIGDSLNSQINFLNGNTNFNSSIKAYNALGLMAEQVLLKNKEFNSLTRDERVSKWREFLVSRKINHNELFTEQELDNLKWEEVSNLDNLNLMIWMTFAHVPIVCSTSSNMGIALHEALRMCQQTNFTFREKSIPTLNNDEGKLIIWCPDPEADFMSPEKTAYLNKIANEEPKLTTLRTYINRIERDPGALKEALSVGGYFFPTNPQSKMELRNLIYPFLTETLNDLNERTLQSLEIKKEKSQFRINKGIEGGLAGLMVPYFMMLDQNLGSNLNKNSFVWNQASIGAALAAAVLAEDAMKKPKLMNDYSKKIILEEWPKLGIEIDGLLRAKSKRQVIGVFDTANLQSLAQLLGVVVTRHRSGRGSPFVGLGSSSYSNGNLCFDILKSSEKNGKSFLGSENFFPATHAINPIAQAIIYGSLIAKLPVMQGTENFKPEPAGAASLAGFLLHQLDNSFLSTIELSLLLRKLGYTNALLMELAFNEDSEVMRNRWLTIADDEGDFMGNLIKDVFYFLELPTDVLIAMSRTEKKASIRNLKRKKINSKANIFYLTGNNTSQPSKNFHQKLLENQKVFTSENDYKSPTRRESVWSINV
jgi:hypothetical protein